MSATCTIETGLLRKKPCGHAAVTTCLNCEQPLCISHAVAQLSETGHKTGKSMCQECDKAAKEHAKSMVGVARTQEARKMAALDKAAREHAAAPPAPPKKPPAGAPPSGQTAAAAAEAPKESGALEFTPSKPDALEFTPSKKEDKPG